MKRRTQHESFTVTKHRRAEAICYIAAVPREILSIILDYVLCSPAQGYVPLVIEILGRLRVRRVSRRFRDLVDAAPALTRLLRHCMIRRAFSRLELCEYTLSHVTLEYNEWCTILNRRMSDKALFVEQWKAHLPKCTFLNWLDKQAVPDSHRAALCKNVGVDDGGTLGLALFQAYNTPLNTCTMQRIFCTAAAHGNLQWLHALLPHVDLSASLLALASKISLVAYALYEAADQHTNQEEVFRLLTANFTVFPPYPRYKDYVRALDGPAAFCLLPTHHDYCWYSKGRKITLLDKCIGLLSLYSRTEALVALLNMGHVLQLISHLRDGDQFVAVFRIALHWYLAKVPDADFCAVSDFAKTLSSTFKIPLTPEQYRLCFVVQHNASNTSSLLNRVLDHVRSKYKLVK